jgi:hypothetical protein
MDFSFDYEIGEVGLIDSKLLLCDDNTCLTSNEFQGPLNCTNKGCNSYALWGEYEEYVEYHKLVLTFDDQVRESNVFTKHAHSAKYKVVVSRDALTVTEDRLATIFNPYLLLCFSGALFLTSSIEAIAATIYLRLMKIKLRMLIWVVLANIISLSLIWFILAQILETGEVVFILIAETFAVVFEAAFLYFFGRKIGVNLGQAIILSLFMNAASFSLGYLGWYFLARP